MTALDESILQCLIIDGRAPFRRVAEVVGVSEQTVARRVRALYADGVARVVVRPSGFTEARRSWAVRIRCRPDAAARLADALADRRDVGWVALVSGGSEILCTATAPAGSESESAGVLAHLPRTSAVLSFTAQALLRSFAGSRSGWTVFDEQLREEQVSRLLDAPDRASVRGGPSVDVSLSEADAPLVAALARDGRATVAALAREIGWPPSRVSSRLEALLRGGLLYVGTDVLPEAFGYHATAVLYLTVPPGSIVDVGEGLAAHDETVFVAATTGAASVFALVTCRTADHLFRYVSERVGSLPGVAQMDLVPYVRRVKEFGSRVVDGRLVPDD